METFDGIHLPLLPGTTLIEASAGTGKTYSITTLYLRLVLEQGMPIQRILAVTYTEAATKELIGRIRTRLQSALSQLRRFAACGAMPEEPVLQNWLSQQHPIPTALQRLDLALQSFDEAVVFTIHGFCYRMLQEHAFESGTRPSAEILADSDSLYQQVTADFWRRHLASGSPLLTSLAVANGFSTLAPWLDLLRQTRAHPLTRLLPEAPPQPVEEPALATILETLLALWSSVRNEIPTLLGKESGVSQAKTAFRPDRLAQLIAGIDQLAAEAADSVPAAAMEALHAFCSSHIESQKGKKKPAPQHPFFDACERFCQQVRALFTALQHRFLEETEATLEQLKRERNVLLFDDLLRRFHAALEGGNGANGPVLRRLVAAKFDAVLIDEFQDTDPLQASIFDQLFGRGEHQLFLIGDPKQAIYGFRGADVYAYLRAAANASRRFGLEVNWRSDARLLEGFNALFTAHPNPFLEPEIRYTPVLPAPQNQQGREPSAPLVLRRHRLPGLEERERPLPQEKSHPLITHQLVLDLLESRQRYRFGEMAVLVRNRFEAALVHDALLARGIPAVRHTDDSVYHTEEARQLHAFLDAVADPQGRGLVARAVAMPFFDRAQYDDETWIERFAAWRDLWFSAGFMALFRAWMVECHVRERLLRSPKGERRLTNLLHLGELLHREETTLKHGPEALIGFLHTRQTDDHGHEEAELRLESDAEAVQIVTIHKSKGLEYAVVIAPFLWKEVKVREPLQYRDPQAGFTLDLRPSDEVPEAYAQAQHEAMAEEMRLLYVALTRAKHRCLIYWGDFGGVEKSALVQLLPAQEQSFNALAEALAAAHPQAITITELADPADTSDPSESPLPPLPQDEEASWHPARTFRGHLRRTALATSFTGLAAGTAAEAPERDEASGETLLLPADPPTGIHAFAKGIRAGDFFHEVMESIDFQQPENPALIAEKLALYGFPHQPGTPWLPIIGETVRHAVTRELLPGLCLTGIPPEERLVEADFSCRLPSLQPADLLAIARRHPGELDPALYERLHFAPVEGFLRGAIDLFFRHDGRFYLLDWKSNWLGPDALAYTPARMAAAMREHHYGLQALLYLLAADRYLALRQPGYDYERDFGGVFYCFLRGLGTAGNGVVHLRPSLAVVESLRTLTEKRR